MLFSAALLSLAASTILPATSSASKLYIVPLTAAAEVVEPAGLTGDSDGAGTLLLTVDTGKAQVCYDFTLSGLATPLMAHIHKGPALQNGPSVVTLFTGPGGQLHDCLQWTDKWLTAIVADPAAFYVEVSTTEFPDGALRGQLGG